MGSHKKESDGMKHILIKTFAITWFSIAVIISILYMFADYKGGFILFPISVGLTLSIKQIIDWIKL